MMKTKYQCLDNNEYTLEGYSLVPIRLKDRYKIMQWRNEQMFHLRQKKELTVEDQDAYFKKIVSKLFDQDKPKQILFSLLKDKECIGYGGLVHIDWDQKRAEISFLVATELEKTQFNKLWFLYLVMIERIAFNQINLNEIYTYSYEVRPMLYSILKQAGFKEKERILNATQQDNNPIDALIHIKKKSPLTNRIIRNSDAKLLFNWANDSSTRNNSLSSNKITWEEHVRWFEQKISDPKTKIYLFFSEEEPLGVLRLEEKYNSIKLSFSVDYKHRGKGIGGHMIVFALKKYPKKIFKAEVIESNNHSHNIFLKNKFIVDHVVESTNHKIIHYKKFPHGEY